MNRIANFRQCMLKIGLVAVSIAVANPNLAVDAAGVQPNVIVVFADQLRSFEMGCYGHPLVNTPHMDQLAAEGMRFELGISNTPVCVPARSTLLSGQYSRTCVGSRINEMATGSIFGRNDRKKFPYPTMPEMFKAMGYHTVQVGKWHVDTRPSLMGFDESLVTAGIFSKGTFYRNEGSLFSVTDFSADYEVKEAVKFLQQPHDQPFFMYYNIISPHMPLLDVPYRYSTMYKPEEVYLRGNVWKNGTMAYDKKWFNIYMWQKTFTDANPPLTAAIANGFDLRNLTALYDGAVTWTDDLLGLLMDSLRQQGLDTNTIVLLSSDHGEMLGSHQYWNKDRLYEEAIRVPMIVRWPAALAAGRVNNTQIVSLVDVMPTLLDLCGGEVPAFVQGQSFAPVLRGEAETLARNYAIIETPLAELGVRTPDHLYGVTIDKADTHIENNANLFFDIGQDPEQMTNLVGTGQQQATADQLKALLTQWDQETPRLTGVDYVPFSGSPLLSRSATGLLVSVLSKSSNAPETTTTCTVTAGRTTANGFAGDLFQNATVSANFPAHDANWDIRDLFTKGAPVKREEMIFADVAGNDRYFVDFHTSAPVVLTNVVIGLINGYQASPTNDNRAVTMVRLYAAPSAGEVMNNRIAAISINPEYTEAYGDSAISLSINVSADHVQYFRAEFVGSKTSGSSGPRIMEIDGFGTMGE